MDTLEVNKVFSAVLVAGIAFMGSAIIADYAVSPSHLEKPAIAIAAPAAPVATAAAEMPLPVLLASATPQEGEAQVKKQGCVACHSFNEGGKAGIGPNLYGVVGGPHAHMVGFNYSSALKAKEGPWTVDELNEWLTKPSAYAPGTKMTYAGLADPKARAQVIVYLHSISASAPPLPAAPVQTATAQPASAQVPGGAAAPEPSFDQLFASADPKAGEGDTKKVGCVACHSFTEGGKAGIGPNLYGVVGGPHAHMVGFNYSAALKAKEGPWTVAELNEWLTKPSAYAPGTKMTFAGVPSAKTRADIVAYLKSLAPSTN